MGGYMTGWTDMGDYEYGRLDGGHMEGWNEWPIEAMNI